MNPQLADRWLPLLRELTHIYPKWSIWKNPESALTGPGDIDSLAPPDTWNAIEQTFRHWVIREGMHPLIICRHIPQGPHFIAIDPGWPHLLVLDVKERGTWRGSTLVDHQRLSEVSEIDDRGFRRVRPGAEGVIKLLNNGVLKGGRPNTEGLNVKGVVDLLRSDREGVEMAATWVRPLSSTLLKAVDRLLDGEWDRKSMIALEMRFALKSFLEPNVAASRFFFNHYTLQRCTVLRAIRNDDRRIPDNADAWYEEVAVEHEIELEPEWVD